MSNTEAKEELVNIFGPVCFLKAISNIMGKENLIEGLKKEGAEIKDDFFEGIEDEEITLTYHHIIKEEDGGKATIENGALLSKKNHEWLNKQPRKTQILINKCLQIFKRKVFEIKNIREQYGRLDYKLSSSIDFSRATIDYPTELRLDGGNKYRRTDYKEMNRAICNNLEAILEQEKDIYEPIEDYYEEDESYRNHPDFIGRTNSEVHTAFEDDDELEM